MATKITKNFTLEEFIKSSTATRLKIDNTPTAEVKANIIKLCETVLQPIREKFGKPIVVSSGYRCPKLNQVVGGATTSQHKNGCAADFHTQSDTLEDNMKLWKVIMDMVKNKELDCRQIIFEYGKKNVGPDWIHIGINHPSNTKKNNQILYLGCK